MSIKIITPPDIIFDRAPSILLICPGEDISTNLNKFLLDNPCSMNIYLFDNNQDDVQWLLTLVKISNNIIVDIDNVNDFISQFLSYILSFPNTYYRCLNEKAPWGLLNKNKFFDFPNIEITDERI